MSAWIVVAEWITYPGLPRVTVITRHWWRWSAQIYIMAAMCPFGPRPVGYMVAHEIQLDAARGEGGQQPPA